MSPVHAVFNNPTARSILVKLRYPIAIIAFAFFLPHLRMSLMGPGFLVSMLGEIIQGWSFASLDKNAILTIRGPYRVTRNPMYIGRYILLLGCLILTGSLWLIIAFTVIYYFYMVNRVGREEIRLKRLFGTAYDAYCGRVNRFLPSPRSLRGESLWFFDPHLFIRNNGHWNLAAVMAAYTVFFLFGSYSGLTG